MGKPYPMDLRERVVKTVEHEGLSLRQAAERFDIVISTAINWLRRQHEKGSLEPDQIGGYKPRRISGAHHDCLV